jgi:hypothetical protein
MNSEPTIAVEGNHDNVVPERPAAPKYTRAEIGKARRQFITKTFGTVTKCGHKFHPTDNPTTNCEFCWEAYFATQDGIRIGVQSIVETFGEAQLVKVRGAKFVKMWKRFLATQAPTPIESVATL